MVINDFTSFDGKTLKLYEWTNVSIPKGVFQIVHGMSEHMGRYDEFAKYLNAQGFLVYGDDHRGHGKTESDISRIGKVDPANPDIFELTLKDEFEISKMLKEKHGELPLILFGHSYGSFLTQKYIQISSDLLACAIICGSAYMKGSMDVVMGSFISKKMENDRPASLICKMSFDKYNKKMPFGKWITRDNKISDAYYKDEYCNKVFSYGFYKSFFKGLKGLYNKESLQKINKELPIYVISGEKDCVGGCGKLVKKLIKMYQTLGIKNLESRIYHEDRHEILNELDRHIIFGHIVEFANKYI